MKSLPNLILRVNLCLKSIKVLRRNGDEAIDETFNTIHDDEVEELVVPQQIIIIYKVNQERLGVM